MTTAIINVDNQFVLLEEFLSPQEPLRRLPLSYHANQTFDKNGNLIKTLKSEINYMEKKIESLQEENSELRSQVVPQLNTVQLNNERSLFNTMITGEGFPTFNVDSDVNNSQLPITRR